MSDSRGIKFKCGGSYSTGFRASQVAVVALMVPSLFFVLSIAAVRAQEAPVLSMAPLNPAYVEYMAKKQAAELTGTPLSTAPPGGHTTGYIPPRIDFSYLRKPAALRAIKPAVTYPSSFDLRTKNKVSPVKDQGGCGACWAFASVASLESHLMPTVTNFSEEYIIDTKDYANPPCAGGGPGVAAAAMTAHGVFAQNLYPFQYCCSQIDSVTNPIPATPKSAWAGAFVPYVQLITTGLDSNKKPITDQVKQAVYSELNAVAVSFSIDQSSPYLLRPAPNGDTCYYNDGTSQSADGHAVAIVGWNDNYSATNFGKTPPGNGAYLIKNSWGTPWGSSGYFWMSYYEPTLNNDAYVFNAASPTSPYNWVYQYDSRGDPDKSGYGSSTTGSMANVFKASPQGRVIRAVSFWTLSPGTNYTVRIYDRCPTTANNYADSPDPVVDPVGGNLLITDSGTFTTAGYNTHKLSKSVTVSTSTTSPENFSVVVTVSDTTGTAQPLALETANRSDCIMGQSYMSPDGAEGNWTDLFALAYPTPPGSGYRATIKAFGTAN